MSTNRCLLLGGIILFTSSAYPFVSSSVSFSGKQAAIVFDLLPDDTAKIRETRFPGTYEITKKIPYNALSPSIECTMNSKLNTQETKAKDTTDVHSLRCTIRATVEVYVRPFNFDPLNAWVQAKFHGEAARALFHRMPKESIKSQTPDNEKYHGSTVKILATDEMATRMLNCADGGGELALPRGPAVCTILIRPDPK